MFARLTIGQKVLTTLSVAAAVMTAFAVTAVVQARTIAGHLATVVDARIPSMQALVGLRDGVNTASRGLNGSLLPEVAASAHDYSAGNPIIEGGLAEAEEACAAWERLPHSKEAARQWDTLMPLYRDWARSARETFGAMRSWHDALVEQAPGAPEATALRARAMEHWRATRAHYVAMAGPLADLVKGNQDRVGLERNATDASVHTAETVFLVAGLLALAFLAVVGLAITRSVRRGIAALVRETGNLTEAVAASSTPAATSTRWGRSSSRSSRG